MALTCGNQMSKILVEVLNLPIHLVADVRICFRSWCVVNITSVWENSRVAGGDNAIGISGDFCLDCVSGVRRGQELLHVWVIRQPGQAMHVRAATVLPLKPHPVVGDTKYSDIVGLDKLLDSVIEEPVCDGWILYDGFGTT